MLFMKTYITSFLVFLGIDFLWLTKVAPAFYKNNIGHLMAENPNLYAAAIFYIFNIVGIVIFAVSPALSSQSPKTALLYGALYGALTYATYDLTNLATLKNWPVIVTIVDILWGTILTASVSIVSYYIVQKIK